MRFLCCRFSCMTSMGPRSREPREPCRGLFKAAFCGGGAGKAGARSRTAGGAHLHHAQGAALGRLFGGAGVTPMPAGPSPMLASEAGRAEGTLTQGLLRDRVRLET